MGAFDGDPGVRPSLRAFVAYAAPWEPIPDDGLERFAEGKSPADELRQLRASARRRPPECPRRRG